MRGESRETVRKEIREGEKVRERGEGREVVRNRERERESGEESEERSERGQWIQIVFYELVSCKSQHIMYQRTQTSHRIIAVDACDMSYPQRNEQKRK